VERDIVIEAIDVALQAPTGSNSQNWQWVVVTDADLRRQIADHYGIVFDGYIAGQSNPFPEDDVRTQHRDKVRSSAMYLREHMHEAPVHVIPCAFGRVPSDAPSVSHASYWGSILPAVWSFMLALRARGLGTAWTTLHLGREREVADLLGIPFDEVTQAGLFPVAYTKGTDFKRASRIPATDLVHWNHW
jgi:nitroreductase